MAVLRLRVEMKIIDKAAWHIDGEVVPEELIVRHFQTQRKQRID
jgi:hypothetical protein